LVSLDRRSRHAERWRRQHDVPDLGLLLVRRLARVESRVDGASRFLPVLDHVREPKQQNLIAPTQPPSAMSVVERRLHGQGDDPAKWTWFSTEQLKSYRQSTYRPEQATLIVSGKFDVHPMRKEIESLYGSWRGSSTGKPAAVPAKPARAPSATLIAADDAPTIFAPATESPRSEKAARDVLSEILNDRMRVIREGLGVSYGVYARASTTAVLIGGDVDLAYANEASRAFMTEIEHVRAGYPEFAADFSRARKRLLARAIAAPVGAEARAEQLERIALDHVSLDQPDRDVEAIQVLDLDAVRSLAARDLRPERMIAAVRGPTAAIRSAIAALGIDPAKVETLKPAK
jgi:zinc protease